MAYQPWRNPYYSPPPTSGGSSASRQQSQGQSSSFAAGRAIGSLGGIIAYNQLGKPIGEYVAGVFKPYATSALESVGLGSAPVAPTGVVASRVAGEAGAEIAGEAAAEGGSGLAAPTGVNAARVPTTGTPVTSPYMGAAQFAGGAYMAAASYPHAERAVKEGDIGGGALYGGATGMGVGLAAAGGASMIGSTALAGSYAGPIGAAIGAVVGAALATGVNYRWGKGHKGLDVRRREAVRENMVRLGLLEENPDGSLSGQHGIRLGDNWTFMGENADKAEYGGLRKNWGAMDLSAEGGHDKEEWFTQGSHGPDQIDWTNPSSLWLAGTLTPLGTFAAGTTKDDVDQIPAAFYMNALQAKYGDDINGMRNEIRQEYQSKLGLNDVQSAMNEVNKLFEAGAISEEDMRHQHRALFIVYGQDTEGNKYDAYGNVMQGSPGYGAWQQHVQQLQAQGQQTWQQQVQQVNEGA